MHAPCEERAGARTPRQDVRLSIAHNDGLASSPPPNPPNNKAFRYWEGASLSVIPAGENKNPNLSKSPPKRGKRGKITTLSYGARRRIVEYLSKIDNTCQAWTMALTLPSNFEHLPPETVHRHFQSLSKRFTGSSLWGHVGVVYKRELQKREALHYHLAFYGVTSETEAKKLQFWIAKIWCRLCAEGSTDPDGFDDHFWWHMRWNMKNDDKSNMQRVRSTIASYFAKYLGKAEDAPDMVIPGKWWGKLNQPAIPEVEEKELTLPSPVRDISRRWASKLQAKRVQHGLYVSACTTAKLVVRGEDGRKIPVLSLQEFHAAAQPISSKISENSPLFCRLWSHREMRKAILSTGYRQGRHNRPRPSKFGKITLVGSSMPKTCKRIVRFAAELWRYNHKNHTPF